MRERESGEGEREKRERERMVKRKMSTYAINKNSYIDLIRSDGITYQHYIYLPYV